MGVVERLRTNFFRDTVLPLLKSPDDRTYLSVVTILIALMKRAVHGAPLRDFFSRMLLLPRISPDLSAKIFVCPSDFPKGESNSLFEEFVVSRVLDVSPKVSAATLSFIDAIAHLSPFNFMHFALFYSAIDPSGEIDRAMLSPPYVEKRQTESSLCIPGISVKELFCASLCSRRREKLCGTPLTLLGDEITQTILTLEGNLPLGTQRFHNPIYRGSAKAAAQIDALPRPAYLVPSGDDSNVFFNVRVHQSRLIHNVAEVLSCVIEHESSVALTVTQLCVTLCALPDLRIMCTLLDPGRGTISGALRKVSQRIEGALALPQPSTGFSRMALFQRTVERPFFEAADRSVADVQFRVSMEQHRTFVEACAILEGFRVELDSAVGYQLLSLRLSQLSGTPGR
jgi:hypothetical protein